MDTEKEKKQLEVIENINDFPTKEEEDRLELEKFKAEENFQKAQERIVLRKKLFKMFGIFLVVGLFIFSGFLIYVRSQNDQQVQNISKKEIAVNIPEDKEGVFINNNALDEEVVTAQDSTEGFIGTSEKYRLRDVAIGGGATVLAAEIENTPVKISNVRTETLMSKDGKTIKLLVSWESNKPARSEIKYQQGAGAEKSLKENGFGFTHALVLNKLDQATRYTLNVEIIDRQGNKDVSEKLAVFTGSKPISIFDLISIQMNDIFGWALKN